MVTKSAGDSGCATAAAAMTHSSTAAVLFSSDCLDFEAFNFSLDRVAISAVRSAWIAASRARSHSWRARWSLARAVTSVTSSSNF